jgi:hypothetical protein
MIYAILLLIETAVKALVFIFSIPVRLILALANACSRHNRRRAVRQAFARDQQRQGEFYAQRAPQSQQWPPPIPVQPWRYGAPSTHRRGYPGDR